VTPPGPVVIIPGVVDVGGKVGIVTGSVAVVGANVENGPFEYQTLLALLINGYFP
jgi:hypothetical protein